MATRYSIHKKWIENFKKSPLVDKQNQSFKKSVAWQLFYGKKSDDYPPNSPSGFEAFYNSHYELDRLDALDMALNYLNVIGIKLRKEAVLSHLALAPADFHLILKKCFYLIKTLAYHRENLNVNDPYSQNRNDIYYLVNIETGQSQLTIFDADPKLVSKNDFKIPDGYEDDPVVKELFSRIEGSNDSFFITGKAGTGKSTFIHFFNQKSNKQIALVAFTGIAAMNIGGVTIHSFFKFPTRSLLPEDDGIAIFPKESQRRKVIEDIETIVIDEVSMLRADLLQSIDFSLRNNGGDPDKLFGGKQLIFVGDIFQLPPVTNDSDDVEKFLFSELYKSAYFFDCDAYKLLGPQFFEI
jgi:ATP-dependent DNA helicase PIF1